MESAFEGAEENAVRIDQEEPRGILRCAAFRISKLRQTGYFLRRRGRKWAINSPAMQSVTELAGSGTD